MEDRRDSPMTKSKKRKIISDYQSSSSSSSEDDVCHKEKRYKCKGRKYKKTYHKKSVEDKKLKKPLEQDQKSFKKINEKSVEFINEEKKDDKQIEFEVWWYLLHHLEESEKLIALKLLVSINEMKKKWKNNFIKSNFVDKKVVDNMQLVIKTLQDKQEKNEEEKRRLIQEKSELEKRVLEERRSRIQLAETLANEIEKSKKNISNKVEVTNKIEAPDKVKISNKVEESNKTEDKQQSQATEIVSKQKSSTSTSKTSLNDSNNNTQVSKMKVDIKKEVDLREVLNHRENLGIREHHIDSALPPIRHFSQFVPLFPFKRIPAPFDNRLGVYVKTSIRYFPELMQLIENKLGIPMRFNRVILVNEGWKIEFLSLNDKMCFLKKNKQLSSAGLFITNLYRTPM